MVTLEELRARVAALLSDTAGLTWTGEALDRHIGTALDLLNLHIPQAAEATLTLAQPGVELPVDWDPALLAVGEARWPFNPAAGDCQPENRVLGWMICWDANPPALRLKVQAGRTPAAGEAVWVRYSRAHRVAGLNGATETTLQPGLEGLLALGGASFAALAALNDPGCLPARQALGRVEQRFGLAFFDGIDQARLASLRTGATWGEGWG